MRRSEFELEAIEEVGKKAAEKESAHPMLNDASPFGQSYLPPSLKAHVYDISRRSLVDGNHPHETD